jgi:hypothetical protein
MRKLLSMVLVGLLVFFASGGQTPAQRSGKDEAKALEKIKAKIAKLGVGEKARAQIKLRNGQKMKGYVSSAGKDDFAFTERKSSTTTTVAYADIVEVKKPGLSTGAKIAIAVGIGVGVLAVLALVVVHGLNNLDINGIRIP